MLAKFQNPAEADKIMKIEKELEEVFFPLSERAKRAKKVEKASGAPSI